MPCVILSLGGFGDAHLFVIRHLTCEKGTDWRIVKPAPPLLSKYGLAIYTKILENTVLYQIPHKVRSLRKNRPGRSLDSKDCRATRISAYLNDYLVFLSLHLYPSPSLYVSLPISLYPCYLLFGVSLSFSLSILFFSSVQ